MARHGNRRATVTARTAHGDAEVRPDPSRAAGWTVLVDGVPQSYVDPTDPRHLPFSYVRRLARLLDVAAPAGVPLRVLHLGGGGLSLPRYTAATRPGSVQHVVEHDAALADLVADILPPPDGVTVTVDDARAFVDTGPRERYDAVLVDVFAGAALPPGVAGTGFAAATARLRRPGGVLGMNLTDVPPLAFTRIQAATLRTAWPGLCLIADAGLIRGRRAGNVVLAAGAPVDRLATAVARDATPGRLLHGAELDTFISGARPRLDTPR